MKKIPLALAKMLLALALALSLACQAKTTTVDPSALPQAVIDATAVYAPGATITKAQVSTSKLRTLYKISAHNSDDDTSYRLVLNPDGSLAQPVYMNGAISPSSLPAAVIGAVNKLEAGILITRSQKVANGANVIYKVWAKGSGTSYYLVFNPDGSYAKLPHSEAHVAPATLPAAVIVAVSAVAPAAAITDALLIADGNNVCYKIHAADATTRYYLVLGSDGSRYAPVHSETPLAVAALPSAVVTAIFQAVSGAVVTKATRVADGANVVYNVTAKAFGVRYSLVLNPDGSLVKPVQTCAPQPGDDLPQAVLDVLAGKAPTATITKVTKVTSGGVTAYKINAQSTDAKYSFYLKADGTDVTPMHSEQTIAVASLPAPITAAVKANVLRGTLTGAKIVTNGTKSNYVVTSVANGKTYTVTVDVAGTVLKISRK